jgi:hypothetical protein
LFSQGYSMADMAQISEGTKQETLATSPAQK